MPSRSLRKLVTRLRDIEQLLENHTIIGGTGRGRRWNLESLNRAGLVLCSAHLEGFVEDLFEEAGRAVLNSRINVSRVPVEMKLISVSSLAESVRRSPDRKDRERALREILRKAGQLAHPRRQIRKEDIDLKLAVSRFGNPSPREISRLFTHLGIDNILGRATWQGMSERTVSTRIKRLVDDRNRIAHGTLGVRVRRDQIDYYRRFLARLGRRLDELVRMHIARVIRRNPWR